MKTLRLALLALVLVAAGFMAGRWRAGSAGGETTQAALPRYQCPMHPGVIQDHPGDCPICGMKTVAIQAGRAGAADAGASGPAGTVVLDAGKRQLQGVRVGTVERAAASQTLRLFGRVVPDEARVHSLNAAMEGSFRKVADVTTGSRVRRGQWLGAVFMVETRAALQAYITALDVEDLDPRMHEDKGVVMAAGTTPNRNAQFAGERLLAYGMSQRQLDELRVKREIPLTLDVYSPTDGFVLLRNVTPDQKFERGAEWFRVANLDKVWIMADLSDADAGLVRPGQQATVTLPGRRGTLAAVVSDVLPQFDAAASTLKVRLVVDNPGAVLRPEMYVDVDLAVERPEALTVPVDAVVDGGVRKTVFIERGDGVFEPRRVETGYHLGDRVEIVKGLAEGDRIVVSGTFMVDSESQLRAAAAGVADPERRQEAAAPGVRGEPARDPVCGMQVDEAKARAAGATLQHAGKTYYFCSEQCRKAFAAAPASHLGASDGQGAGQGHEHGHGGDGAMAHDEGHRHPSL